MANHVLYDRIWESKRLKACSRDAALAYPTIFLIADDHGRFEYNPRRIWSKAFGNREDVSLEDVTGWLREYAREKLLIRYHIDGDLAYWYGFKGRKPSERRPSAYPDPDGLPEFTETATQGAEKRGSGGGKARVEPRQIDARDRSEQIRTDQIESRKEQPAYVPPDIRTENALRAGRTVTERRLLAAVGAICERTGQEATDVMKQVTAYKRKSDDQLITGRLNPALLSEERLEKSLEDAEAWLATLTVAS